MKLDQVQHLAQVLRDIGTLREEIAFAQARGHIVAEHQFVCILNVLISERDARIGEMLR